MKRRTAIAALSTAALLAWWPAAGTADIIDVLRVGVEPSADGESWQLSADFALVLNPQLEEAVSRGVSLTFLVEFEMTRPRWYWWDDRTTAATQTHRLSYHALTRQYRVLLNGVPASFPSLAEALDAMSRLRGWRVMPRDRTRPGITYDGWLRLRLDTGQLPRPLQITALTNRDWTPQSEWKRFAIPPPETPRSAP
ncbi:MAG TPA: DUF4390 domain-containing protein [Burkholderiaceae bacterium]|nr:DUF4390 domain-containing protein [Burkholderiaceae bacterium]